MSDMSAVIEPKTDQLNSDSLMAGPITITIKSVSIRPGTEQPVSIFYDGDEGKPWKPCKSMARILVAAWGADSAKYAGRSLTLYRDPKVKWGGMEVGGIRVSHMSDMSAPLTVALTETKQTRKPFTVRPLTMPERSRQQSTTREAPGEETQSGAGGDVDILDWAASFIRGLAALETGAEVEAAFKRAKAAGYVLKLKAVSGEMAKQLVAAVNERFGELGAG